MGCDVMENSVGFREGKLISAAGEAESGVGTLPEHPHLLTPDLQHCLFIVLKAKLSAREKESYPHPAPISTRHLSWVTSFQSPGTSARSALCGHVTEETTRLREVKGLYALQP